ncbi:MAG: phosphoesterase, partial [Caldiserica bacterium]|nr:phosphoesterase [Caldisericota bacterium]
MKKLFFSVDAHGANFVWRKWLSAVNMYHADILILSGDLTGKVFVPIIKQNDGTWKYSYFGTTFTLKNEDEVKAAIDRLDNAAIYPFLATGAEVSELQKDEKKLQDLMNKLIWDRLDQWLKMLIKAVDTSKVMTIVMPGNDDFFIFDDL